jgi:hypothetical protein
MPCSLPVLGSYKVLPMPLVKTKLFHDMNSRDGIRNKMIFDS